MTAIKSTPRHPSSGDLLRGLDGELDARMEARLAEHLNRCEECRGRLREMMAESREASDYLRRIPVENDIGVDYRGVALAAIRAASARRRAAVRNRRGWAVAASVATLLVISLAVDPLRAWVLQRLVGYEAPLTAGAPVVSLPSTVVGDEGSVIAFETQGSTFDLQVERVQPGGELFLQVRDTERATAQITNAAGETMLVLPAGLRIENTPTSAASYRVTLPVSVDRVLVRIGEEIPRVIEVPDGEISWSERIFLAPR